MGSESEEKKEMLIIDGNAFYEIDLECVKKKKQCAQTVHPEKKTDRQIIEDAKRTVEAIRLTLNDWEYTIPQGMIATILDRVEYLKETLQELVKGDANEDDV